MFKTSMKIAGGAAIAALASVSAMAADGPAMQQDAFYASTAITSGNLAKAEQILQPSSYTDARDPARLINLATVYAQTQRLDKARATLELVRRLPDEALVLAGGVSFSSHNIAKAMMDRLP